MTRLTRPDLDGLPAYVPGRNLADLARELGITEAIKLASNEVPYGPLPGVPEAAAEAMLHSHRYPDMAVAELRDTLAKRFGVDAQRVVTGCGSVALTELLIKATCLPGDEVIYAWRSFEAYPIVAAGAATTSVRIPNTAAHGHDLPAMAAAITDRTRVIFVCNPNNPTGTALRTGEIARFLAAVPSDVLVVLDEAYRELVTDPDVPDGLEAYGDRQNVAVLRTMSKAWGLAGLRMGYLVAHPEVATAVRKVLTPFSTSTVAQAAALAALRQADEMARRCALVTVERDRVTEALRNLEVDVPDSQANFVWLPLGDGALPFAAYCERQGVIVRPFPGDGVRVSIGTSAENDLFLAAAEAALKQIA
ncbi:histidinol-phosphate transaminase [Actinoplanes sp. TBRC 11911]|uniref:histidinol-phosphate transaminase n=1 Tax=Actinoplanes sp. TBRC 11911 TaxID=2729386 RepID=UPI00145E2D1E|nr:histidinol-phosphate transaminase [Actinoplanes sp. TBRC 11911]NMO52102.1 histidinol-phosphate transaminase [Actinoplanes sp. TBRC 11911]